MRLLSIVQWHHFAYMIISLALLGYGVSGTFIALFKSRLQRALHGSFAASAALFAISAVVCFVLAQRIPFNGLELVWNPYQLVYLSALYLLFLVPFLFAAICVGLALTTFAWAAGRVYLFDLLGAGCGALAIVAVLFFVEPQGGLKFLAAVAMVAASLACVGAESARVRFAGSLTATAVLLLLVIPMDWLVLRLSPYKGLSQALAAVDARPLGEYSNPLGLLTVVDNPTIPFRYAPGLSFNAPRGPPRQLAVFTDGDAVSAITHSDGSLDSLTYLDYTPGALPYHLLDAPRVLVLGAGGGHEVLLARYLGASWIDAVELNPLMVRLLIDDLGAFAGDLFTAHNVAVHVSEARAFVAHSRARFDLIKLALLDSAAASGAGVHALSESYLYTVEAFASYLQHLSPGGMLAITRWLKLPPRDSLKLMATAIDALRRAGVADPSRHLAMVRSWNTVTLLVRNGVFSSADIERLREFCRARSFDAVYYHGMPASEANRFNLLSEPYFHMGATRLLTDAAAFTAQYKFHLTPATDDQPYFYHFFKWRTLPELYALRAQGGAGLIEWGYLLLVATLLQAGVAGGVLILLPLWLQGRSRSGSGGLRTGSYFFVLGLAFLFIEIAFIQKLILFLGNPVYAVAVVLSGFLVFAGLGSGFSTRFDKLQRRRRVDPIHIVTAIIAVIATGYVLLLLDLLPLAIGLAEPLKVLLALLVIAPLAFCMGMPFPIGLHRVSERRPDFLPWAWGLNGFA
ncbi:MAG: SAM-dependent methyltransferase, partial [Gammaproteobacteria bacterium]|nr:SAM-dependent methyltransferase [Gammaproteobacteria bacterium]